MPETPAQILLVDHDPAMLRLITKWLESCDFHVTCAGDGQAAREAIEASCPQILMVDWELPYMGGLELCRWLRQQDLPRYVYTILNTSRSGTDDMMLALESGADDFLKKPVDKAELVARVRAGVRVLALESKLSTLARTDSVTGLVTRRTFFELAEREWTRARRHHIPLSVVMIDIDFFKRINDTYGHRVGDQALRCLATILQESCRGSDVVGRYGGEEFCVLLSETDEEQAVQWADRVRDTIAKQTQFTEQLGTAITASFGVAERLADTQDLEGLVELADQALLVAKRSGRDRVVASQALTASAAIQSTDHGPNALFQGLTARQVMTTIVAGLNERESVGSAARYFLRFRLHSAPIVDQAGQLVGILSEQDVMSIMLWPKWWTKQIQDVMKRNVVCYEETTPVLTIYEFLCRVSLRGVIIVDQGRPTGTISRGSLLRWFTNLLTVNYGTAPDGDVLQAWRGEPLHSSTEPREKIAMILRALAREVADIDCRIEHESHDLVPALVGGVSKIEELLNDLLAFSRHAHLAAPHEGSVTDSLAVAPTFGKLTDFLALAPHDSLGP